MKAFLKHFWKYVVIVIGSAIYSLGLSYFLKPAGLITGGITGISMMLNYAFNLPVGVLILVMNIPLFLIGAWKLGWRFLISSAIGMISLSVLVDVFKLFATPLTDNPLLAAGYGGLVTGLGLGIVFAVGGTTGGTDIVAKLLRLRFAHMNMGKLVLILDVVILGGYAVIFNSYEKAMYSVVTIFIASKMIDWAMYGINYGKLAYIISNNVDDISRAVSVKLGRSVTILNGRGGYTHDEKNVILCAIKSSQIQDLKRLIKEADPSAFVIITETREVLGLGFNSYEV